MVFESRSVMPARLTRYGCGIGVAVVLLSQFASGQDDELVQTLCHPEGISLRELARDIGSKSWSHREDAKAVLHRHPRRDAALRALEQALRDDDSPELRIQMCELLGALGESGVDLLTELLSDERSAVRLAAARGIWQVGPVARRATELLGKTLSTAEPEEVDTIAVALAIVTPGDGRALEAFEAHFLGERPWIESRLQILQCLRRIGPAARGLEGLVRQAGAPTDVERAGAVLAVWEITADDGEAIGKLRALLSEFEGRSDFAGTEILLSAIRDMGPHAAPLLDELVGLLGSDRGLVDKLAYRCLLGLRDHLRPAIPRLEEAVSEGRVKLPELATFRFAAGARDQTTIASVARKGGDCPDTSLARWYLGIDRRETLTYLCAMATHSGEVSERMEALAALRELAIERWIDLSDDDKSAIRSALRDARFDVHHRVRWKVREVVNELRMIDR